jgi:hypothetical protein
MHSAPIIYERLEEANGNDATVYDDDVQRSF